MCAAERFACDDECAWTPRAVRPQTGSADDRRRFDVIINSVSALQHRQTCVMLLKRDATLGLVGAGTGKHIAPDAFALLMSRRMIARSGIGGIA